MGVVGWWLYFYHQDGMMQRPPWSVLAWFSALSARNISLYHTKHSLQLYIECMSLFVSTTNNLPRQSPSLVKISLLRVFPNLRTRAIRCVCLVTSNSIQCRSVLDISDLSWSVGVGFPANPLRQKSCNQIQLSLFFNLDTTYFSALIICLFLFFACHQTSISKSQPSINRFTQDNTNTITNNSININSRYWNTSIILNHFRYICLFAIHNPLAVLETHQREVIFRVTGCFFLTFPK